MSEAAKAKETEATKSKGTAYEDKVSEYGSRVQKGLFEDCEHLVRQACLTSNEFGIDRKVR